MTKKARKTPPAGDTLFRAITRAASAHAGQYRKGTRIPYIYHPLGAARTLIELGLSEDLAAAAALHDVVEDTSVTLAEIGLEFGPEVERIVAACSEPDKSASWEKRKEHTLAHLRTAPMDVLLVAAADKLDNIREIRDALARGEDVWSRFKRPREKQSWYYRALAEIFLKRAGGGPSEGLFKTFAAVVAEVFGDDGPRQG